MIQKLPECGPKSDRGGTSTTDRPAVYLNVPRADDPEASALTDSTGNPGYQLI